MSKLNPQQHIPTQRTPAETMRAIESLIDDLHRDAQSLSERAHYQELIDDARHLFSINGQLQFALQLALPSIRISGDVAALKSAEAAIAKVTPD